MKWNLDKNIMCSSCYKRPAINKRFVLCQRCYVTMWKGQDEKFQNNLENNQINISTPTVSKYQHKAEVLFGQNHPTFHYQPATFLIRGTHYTPDFYDPIHNVFFEVIGSRQRFEQLKGKLKRFKESFPNIKLSICCADGRLYHSTSNQEIVGFDQNAFQFS